MKKHFIFAVIIAAVMMCVSACTEKLELPEVINSEVTGSGIDNNVAVTTSTDENGVNTQSLSYKSWLRVKGQTKADFDNTVTVNLNGELPDVAQEFNIESYVQSLEPRWMYTTQSYEARGSREEDFVTITDSVLVYTVHHFNFNFSYKLAFEVPVYDDGVTREVMPYYRYENIVDKGYTIKQEDSRVKDGKAYACNIYQHTLEVTFNKKVYTLHANVTLLHELGPANQPYIVRSEIVEEGITIFDDHLLTSISIRKKMSTGEVKTSSYGIELCESVTPLYNTPLPVYNYDGNFDYVSSEVTEEDTYLLENLDNNMRVIRHLKQFKINYKPVSLSVEIIGDEAYYDDGVLYHVFKGNNAVGDIEYGGEVWNTLNTGVDEGRSFVYYEMTFTLNIQFGSRVVPKKVKNEICCYM